MLLPESELSPDEDPPDTDAAALNTAAPIRATRNASTNSNPSHRMVTAREYLSLVLQ